MSYEAALNEEINEAAPLDKPAKKARAKTYVQYNEDGTRQVNDKGIPIRGPEPSPYEPVKAVKPPKPPKVVEYQKNEDGTFVLDENGNQIPVKKTRAPKPVEYMKDEEGNFILDEEGNQIPVKPVRKAPTRISRHDAAVISATPEQLEHLAKLGGKRGLNAKIVVDGMTVLDYVTAGGDLGYLQGFVRRGEVVVTAPSTPQ